MKRLLYQGNRKRRSIIEVNHKLEHYKQNVRDMLLSVTMSSNVSIFPNPASEKLIITLGESGDLALINIYTIYGHLIYSEHTTNSQMKVDVSGLKTKGLVIVKVDKRQEISNLKVVLQ